MYQRLNALIINDFRNVSRNWFVLITVCIALMCAVIVNFVIPEDISFDSTYIFVNQTNDSKIATKIDTYLQTNKGHAISTVDQLEAALEEIPGGIGVVISGSEDNIEVDMILYGYENQMSKELSVLEVQYLIENQPIDIEENVRVINGSKTIESIPFNYTVLPLFLLMEPVLMGLFFISALIFFEKLDGNINAFIVSPGGISEYISSKVIVMLALGFMSMCIVVPMTVGFNVNVIALITIVIAGSIFGSGVGLYLSSFFDNLSSAMIWLITLSIVLGVPFVSYFIPTFTPLWVKIMPTYSLLFALKEALFQTGHTELMWNAVVYSGIFGIVLCLASISRYKKNLN